VAEAYRNINWVLTEKTWDSIKLAVLMDIRDELKSLNRILQCDNFIAIPRILREIKKNTNKPRKIAPKEMISPKR